MAPFAAPDGWSQLANGGESEQQWTNIIEYHISLMLSTRLRAGSCTHDSVADNSSILGWQPACVNKFSITLKVELSYDLKWSPVELVQMFCYKVSNGELVARLVIHIMEFCGAAAVGGGLDPILTHLQWFGNEIFTRGFLNIFFILLKQLKQPNNYIN